MEKANRHESGCSGSRIPIYCIVPPHILKEIAQRGTADQKAWAFRTLTVSEQARGQRQAVGLIAALTATATGTKRRTIYDAQQGSSLPGKMVRIEGGAKSKDRAVNEAYDGAGATYDLYLKVYQRNSIDDRGMRLDSTIHYGRNYDNAFWNGQQMVYGDGDGKLFNRFTISIDVIGHELTHGVTQYEAGLDYQDQAGALNESFSDIFGSLVKQYKKKQLAKNADWLIGKGLLAPGVKGKALRSMKEPGTAYDDPILGKDPQPGDMKDYIKTQDDNGGVHLNSGIPNRAFYETAMQIGGRAWEKAGQIWYVTLRDKLRPTAQFKDAAKATVAVAKELYGNGSLEMKAVKQGWASVGIKT
ncbi:MAG: M4 family metallopeptidase [Nitrospirae bacterium]|nr:M4 family metallopeptidase [Candidatus Manganitrophaceae bacterium]